MPAQVREMRAADELVACAASSERPTVFQATLVRDAARLAAPRQALREAEATGRPGLRMHERRLAYPPQRPRT